MTQQDLQQLATVSDLAELEKRLIRRFHIMLSDALKKLSANGQKELSGSDPMTDPERKFYKPREVAHALGLSRSTVGAWCLDGTIKALQEGGKGTRWLIPRSEVERLQTEAQAIEPKQPE